MEKMLSTNNANFNPRPHEGDDLRGVPIKLQCWNFNPRPHEGDDLCTLEFDPSMLISIHVPTRGTTGITEIVGTISDISIHVPTRGTTLAGS